MQDHYVRDQLMKMLNWFVAAKTDFKINPGKLGKHFEQYLEPELWQMLQETYADSGYENTWDSLISMTQLFRVIARSVARDFGFAYNHQDDDKVSAHLKHVRDLPKDAQEMY